MATISGPAAGGHPAAAEYSISTDHISDDIPEMADFPRGEVAPPTSADYPEGSKKGKSEPVDRPMDSQFLTDPRGTRLAEQGHPAFPRAERRPSHLVPRATGLATTAA